MSTATKEKASTGLATINRETYIALRDVEARNDMLSALAANREAGASDGESMFLRIKTPSQGVTTWDIEGEPSKEIRGILVGAFSRGVLWPGDEVKEGTLPALRTDDLVVAYRVGEMPHEMEDALSAYLRPDGNYDWRRLSGEGSPYGWGSGKGGHGKIAKEQRVLFVLREFDMLPVMVTVGPGSLKSYRDFINSLSRQGIPYWQSVVALGLESAKSEGGTTFSRITFKLAGKLSRDDAAAIKSGYTDSLAQSVKSVSVDSE